MLEIRSALSTSLVSGIYGAETDTTTVTSPLVLSERKLGLLYQVAGWGQAEKDVNTHLKNLGFKQAGCFRDTQKIAQISCFKTAPNRALIRNLLNDAIVPDTDHNDLTLVDLSHARTVIRIEGEVARELLARLASVDVSPEVFSVGQFVQTGMHHIGVLIERVDETSYDIFIPVTWAASIWDIITIHAGQFGYRVEGGVNEPCR